MNRLDPPTAAAATADPVTQEFAVDPATAARLEAAAREGAGAMLALAVDDPAWDVRVDQLIAIGRRDVEALAEQARRSLARTTSSEAASAAVHDSLTSLREIAERLDPGAGDRLLRPRRLFGLFPMGEQLSSYFDRYRSAEAAIEAALTGLAQGRDRLLADNVAIDADRRAARPLITAMAEAIHLCAALDARFVKLAAQLDMRDPAKARRMRDSALFHVRQRHGDLLTHMAVAMQGYQLLGIIRSNNSELAKGIERASATTVAALRTAVLAAQTLSSQQLLLDRIAGVTTAAGAAISAAEQPLTDGRARLAHGSAAANAQLHALQCAFTDLHASVAAVDAVEASGRNSIRAVSAPLALESG